MEKTINALADRIRKVPAYTAGDLGATKFRGGSYAVILVKAEHRALIAAALEAYAGSSAHSETTSRT